MTANCSACVPSSEMATEAQAEGVEMQTLQREKSQSTPEVHADPQAGRLMMAGDSYPENSYEFFHEIVSWVENYLRETDQPLHLELRLAYLNTSSVRAMLDIFDLLEEAHQQGRDVTVNWYYDPRNERVVSLADEFKEDCSFTFNIAPEKAA